MPFIDAIGRSHTVLRPLGPTEDPSTAILTTDYFLRQNPHAQKLYPIDFVKATGKIHIPYAHTPRKVNAYKRSEEEFLNMLKQEEKKRSTITLNLPVGSIIVVAGDQKAIIVRITSEVKAGHCAPIYSIRDPSIFDGSSEADEESWKNSRTEYILANRESMNTIQDALRDGMILEPFISLYRDVEVLCDITCDDLRKIAQPKSEGAKKQLYAPVN